MTKTLSQPKRVLPNRVAGGFKPPPPTPPTVRVRSGRFIAVLLMASPLNH
jgi:hypothetical protein